MATHHGDEFSSDVGREEEEEEEGRRRGERSSRLLAFVFSPHLRGTRCSFSNAPRHGVMVPLYYLIHTLTHGGVARATALGGKVYIWLIM